MAKLFDSHAHYYDRRFSANGEDPDLLLDQLFSGDVGRILNVGTRLEDTADVLAQAEKHSGMYAAIGIHPNDGQRYADPVEAVAQLEKQMGDVPYRLAHKIVALGEIGLDYHYPNTDREKQAVLFEAQLCLAEKLGLPVIIHDREAHGDCFETILRHPGARGVFHSYSGSAELARELVRRGWNLSFSGVVTFHNAPKVREALAAVPQDRILIETDCPYLTPEPHRGERNHSGHLVFTAAAVAEVLGITEEEVRKITYANACRLFSVF